MQVAKDPSGKEINALAQHIKNLLSPSTPFFFNTLYDPYREGADFVRGYPFSLREGVPTAVSHGLWLNIPDYDAPTQLVKPLERNTRFNSSPANFANCFEFFKAAVSLECHVLINSLLFFSKVC